MQRKVYFNINYEPCKEKFNLSILNHAKKSLFLHLLWTMQRKILFLHQLWTMLRKVHFKNCGPCKEKFTLKIVNHAKRYMYFNLYSTCFDLHLEWICFVHETTFPPRHGLCHCKCGHVTESRRQERDHRHPTVLCREYREQTMFSSKSVQPCKGKVCKKTNLLLTFCQSL